MNSETENVNPEPEYWEADLCPIDPDNFWIDRVTGERVNAATGERSHIAAPARPWYSPRREGGVA